MLQKEDFIPMGNAMHRRRMGRCHTTAPASSGRFNRCTGQRRRLRQAIPSANVSTTDPVDSSVSALPKSLLEEQKKLLELQLETINQSLEALASEQ